MCKCICLFYVYAYVCVNQVFAKALGEAKITKFNPLGEKFDPERASALFNLPANGKEAGMVCVCVSVCVCVCV